MIILQVGNYFRLRATLAFYLCLAGQIQVKYAFSKLKWCLGGLDVARGPYVAPSCCRLKYFRYSYDIFF